MLIDFGFNYRLVPFDSRNWKLQQLRRANKPYLLKGEDEERWYDTGNYFQHLDQAVAYVYERVLREDGADESMGLGEALGRAEAIRNVLIDAVRAQTSGMRPSDG